MEFPPRDRASPEHQLSSKKRFQGDTSPFPIFVHSQKFICALSQNNHVHEYAEHERRNLEKWVMEAVEVAEVAEIAGCLK